MRDIPAALAGLSDIAQPVSSTPYEGRADSYAVYDLLGQTGQTYAEGREAATGIQWAVHLYTGLTGAPARALLRRVKEALEAAGYIAVLDMYTVEGGKQTPGIPMRTHAMLEVTEVPDDGKV